MPVWKQLQPGPSDETEGAREGSRGKEGGLMPATTSHPRSLSSETPTEVSDATQLCCYFGSFSFSDLEGKQGYF